MPAAALIAACLALAVGATPAAAAEGLAGIDRDALHAEIRAYLLAHPELLTEMVMLLEERQKAVTEAEDRALVAANRAALLDDGFSHVAGNPEGSVTIVEFLDYQCGFCRRAHPDIAELITTDGDIRLIVKELPILGPGSVDASRAALAALINEGPEPYTRLGDLMMRLDGQLDAAALDAVIAEAGLDVAAIRAGMDDPEITRRIDATRGLAEAMLISGTPTFVIADRMVRGYLPLEALRTLVEDARAGG